MSYPEYSCNNGPVEELVDELLQKIPGAVSIIGSAMIVLDVVGKLRRGGQTDPYQRIMLGMSFFDMIHSFFDSVLGSWLVPSQSGWLMAAGNQASCSTKDSLLHLVILELL